MWLPKARVLLRGVLVLCLAAQTGCRLSETRCLDSADHTLELQRSTFSEYRCRKAANHCEQGFVQSLHGQDACEAKPGCAYQPGECYCPPDVVCVCGGGPVSQCAPVTGPGEASL